MLSRLIHYWASKYITEKLLASEAFHRFAVKTHRNVSKLTDQAFPYVDESVKRAKIFTDSFKENLKREAEKAQWPKQ
ncbi:hypothetical protein F8M41_021587 [Gigaspora margarita]|uniref:Uncharacterized protein n=1 Tax=Gigaspora margarita TaxID=4874 RepID=A0A8H4AGE9_GIGMA|nr:hypothetical protein F8M41_021587 [Gigaspora margarita]